uniref:Claudin n=1 Tax=Branchiostoma floridae TaxID=7739 RepID=C3Z872_BRAFL|eukprot:XP_002595184.1 hypothetical protein BRAFLDRAFT_101670 [Branchiostoma floridae]
MTPLNDVFVGGISSTLVGLVMYVVGIATPAWVIDSRLGLRQEWGLWQICTTNIADRTCEGYGDISDLTAAFHFTRAFAVIGPLLLVAGVNVALVFYAEHKNSNKVQRKYGALIIAGGACGVIATAIFGVELRNAIGVELSISFGYSFHLTLVQGLLTVFLTVGGGATIIADGLMGTKDEHAVLHKDESIAMREIL